MRQSIGQTEGVSVPSRVQTVQHLLTQARQHSARLQLYQQEVAVSFFKVYILILLPLFLFSFIYCYIEWKEKAYPCTRSHDSRDSEQCAPSRSDHL